MAKQKKSVPVKLHNLISTKPRKRRRVGRGTGSGAGKTAGRGTKGQNARSGGGVKARFEGGHTPLFRLLPKKRGFNSRFKKIPSVNIAVLDEKFKQGDIVNIKKLKQFRLVGAKHDRYKVLGDGEIKKKLTIFTDAVSKSARAKIEKAGGQVKLIVRPTAAAQKQKSSKTKGNKPKADQASKPKKDKKDVPKVS